MAASVIITDDSDILGHGRGGEGSIRVIGADHSNIVVIIASFKAEESCVH